MSLNTKNLKVGKKPFRKPVKVADLFLQTLDVEIIFFVIRKGREAIEVWLVWKNRQK